MLSESEARQIQDVRKLLGDLQGLARRAGTYEGESKVEAFKYGKFEETCHAAEHALHEVLNVADTYLDDVHAEAALRERTT